MKNGLTFMEVSCYESAALTNELLCFNPHLTHDLYLLLSLSELFVRFRDFATILPNEDNTRCGCDVIQPGMSDANKRRIVLETGTHYEIPKESSPEKRLGSPLDIDQIRVQNIY